MKRRRRRVPVSNLRASLGERIRSREESSGVDWENEFKVQRPSLLRLLFGQMHRHLKLKVTIAVAVVFICALLHYGDFAWTRPLMEGLRYVAGQNMDLRPAADRCIPAFKLAWQERKIPSFAPASGEGGAGLLPFDGQVSGGFGMRVVPGTGQEEMHYGIDLMAAEGTAVKAVLAGRVNGMVTGEGEGIAGLQIEHDSGWQTLYRGLENIALAPGDLVEEGQVLGLLGASTGQASPCLHFELRYRGRPVEPPSGWVDQFEDS